MKICLVETIKDEDRRGSIGSFYIENTIKGIGYNVERSDDTIDDYDIELISVHHSSEFKKVAEIPKRAKLRIIGGHPMQNNPRPLINFGDVLCIGEGESWIKTVIPILEKSNLNVDEIKGLNGTILSKYWVKGDKLPKTNQEKPLPINPPYLNYIDTGSQAWYIEIARGCPYSCKYCELGNSTKYRYYDLETIKSRIDLCDTKKERKINLFAPDEASHPNYNEINEYISKKGYRSLFSSMRIDSILKRDVKIPNNILIRVGLDGLTESTRFKVNKKITNEMLTKYFYTMVKNGHTNFKIFMIFGYEWEQLSDFDEFENTMKEIFRFTIGKGVHLRIKWTPFIPQPITPLANCKPNYNKEMVYRIEEFHKKYRRPYEHYGWYVENDGLMSERTHREQCELTNGDEDLLLNLGYKGIVWK